MHDQGIVDIEYDPPYTLQIQLPIIDHIGAVQVSIRIKITCDIYFHQQHGQYHHNTPCHHPGRHDLMQEDVGRDHRKHGFHTHDDRCRGGRGIFLAYHLQTVSENCGKYDKKDQAYD